ncbi:Bcr/CflA family drug resistance efflux transporter [Pantoea rodasii]|uniref:Bcr/CflA family efflux transporter n=1 Tax=Pantoea rodasii TaxID=1076549 RepID=A0A2M9W744_9GAMM|nr:multidrug effflux MFS transporter [Pantoea rodasii]ORM65409.1 Bcr/CflA family drug resistance efflux transporter [Pantoea rodasii]PJZ03356.1 Bcr/CflA family drug resistance efflux transporter [Pantoea rodasii]
MDIKTATHPPDMKTGIAFIIILSALMAFTSLSTDIYLPAMPAMSAALHGDSELTVTGFLIGFAIAQLIWGPISDQLGRKTPLYIGMIIFAVGSAGCALSSDMPQIVFWRVIQAAGACTGPMLARAMIRDLFTRTRAAQMLSTLIIVMAIAPIAGPLMGGQIIRYSHWPVIFWFLAVVGALMFISLLWLPETLPAEKRVTASPRQVMHNYRTLLQNKNFMRFTLCVTFYYVAAYAFIVGSPAVYISYFGIDPQHYGWLFAINILGLVTVSTVNKRLVQKVRLETLLKSASFIAALMTLVMCFVLKTHPAALAGLVICIFIFFSMNGVIAASATAAALDAVPNATGSASALIGSLQYGSGIVSSLLLAGLNNGTPWIMVSIMTVFTLLSFLITLGGGKSQPKMAEI